MYFIELEDIAEKEIFKNGFARFVHSEQMTTAYWHIKAGAVLPEHSHPHEQISNVISGQFEMTINGETQILEQGRMAVIPSNAVHSGKALSDCFIIDTFCPIREDYR